MGRHVQFFTDPAMLISALEWSWIAQSLQLLANTTSKIAVMTYLATIHGPSHARAKIAFLWTLCFLQVASITVILILFFAQCSPVQKLWNEEIPGTCNGRLRGQNFAYYQGSEQWEYQFPGEVKCITVLIYFRSQCFHRHLPRGVPSCAILESAIETRQKGPAMCAFRVWSTVS